MLRKEGVGMSTTKKVRRFCWVAYAVIFFLLVNPWVWPTRADLVGGILPFWLVYVLILLLAYWGVSIVLAYWGWPLPSKELLAEFEASAKASSEAGASTNK
jgi:hypothetical protein